MRGSVFCGESAAADNCCSSTEDRKTAQYNFDAYMLTGEQCYMRGFSFLWGKCCGRQLS
jgi:hypothetical protein